MRRYIVPSLLLVACTSASSATPVDDRAPVAAASPAPTQAPVPPPVGTSTDPPPPPSDPVVGASCASPIPVGAARAMALPTYAGACPALAAAPATTTITSSGSSREFIVVRPSTIAANESLPVVFLWHWLGGSAEEMASTLDVETAVEARRFVAVIPSAKSDLLFRWPFETTETQDRIDEETRFFDDMLACVASALPVNTECVSSVGVSAGALWTAQLADARSERIASIVSLSGGVGGLVRDWSPAAHHMPAIVLWGGPDDIYSQKLPLINFQKASTALESSLDGEGHFLVECVHNCGHAVPPFDPPPPGGEKFDVVWRFVLDHPYWLPAKRSPYETTLPAAFPSWCAAGKGKAVPRASGAACP